jgi:hypothetical protein
MIKRWTGIVYALAFNATLMQGRQLASISLPHRLGLVHCSVIYLVRLTAIYLKLGDTKPIIQLYLKFI